MKIKLSSGGRGKGGDAECFPVKLLCPDITISKIIFVARPPPPPTLPAAVHPTICCLVKIKMASEGGGGHVSVCPCVRLSVSVRSHKGAKIFDIIISLINVCIIFHYIDKFHCMVI